MAVIASYSHKKAASATRNITFDNMLITIAVASDRKKKRKAEAALVSHTFLIVPTV